MRTLAVAQLAAREALRSRLVVVVGLTLGVGLGALAWTSTGDGTAVGRLRAFLSLGASLTELVLSLTTVFLSTTLAAALKDGRLVQVATGPLQRGLLPFGWWLGTAFALLLLVAGAEGLTWALAHGLAVTGEVKEPAAKEQLARVLSARGVARPDEPDLTWVDARVERELEALERAGELADYGSQQRDELRRRIEDALVEGTRTVGRRRPITWRIDGIEPAPDARFLTLRFRYDARPTDDGTPLPPGGPLGRWDITPPSGGENAVDGRWPGGATHELPAPVEIFDGSPVVQVTYVCLEDRPLAIVFPEDAPVLLYPAGTFANNVLRAALVLLGRLLVIAAVGVAAAALIDGKLAALVALFTLAVGAGNPFLLESLDPSTGYGASSPLGGFLRLFLRLIMPDLSRADLGGALSSGERIEALEVLRAFVGDGLLRAGALLALISIPFADRELGTIR